MFQSFVDVRQKPPKVRERLGEQYAQAHRLSGQECQAGRPRLWQRAIPARRPDRLDWLLRVQVDGKRRDIGLGSYTEAPKKAPGDDAVEIVIPRLHRKLLTLSDAREKAAMLRAAAKAGLDPVAERDKERRSIPTFREAAKATHGVLKVGLTDKREVFIKSLENHVFKSLGDMRVDKIAAADITTALSAPIWTSKSLTWRERCASASARC